VQNFSQINANIKFMNVLPIFCTEIQVFFIKIHQEIDNISCTFVDWKFVYIFNILVKSGHSREVCLNVLNKSLGLDRKNSLSSLAMWRYVKVGGYMAWLVFFQKLAMWRRFQV